MPHGVDDGGECLNDKFMKKAFNASTNTNRLVLINRDADKSTAFVTGLHLQCHTD